VSPDLTYYANFRKTLARRTRVIDTHPLAAGELVSRLPPWVLSPHPLGLTPIGGFLRKDKGCREGSRLTGRDARHFSSGSFAPWDPCFMVLFYASSAVLEFYLRHRNEALLLERLF